MGSSSCNKTMIDEDENTTFSKFNLLIYVFEFSFNAAHGLSVSLWEFSHQWFVVLGNLFNMQKICSFPSYVHMMWIFQWLS